MMKEMDFSDSKEDFEPLEREEINN